MTEDRTCRECKKLISGESPYEHPAYRKTHYECGYYHEPMDPNNTYAGECPHLEIREEAEDD